ncbi:unnamed protein product, partial [Scytosiphon promiscuus]
MVALWRSIYLKMLSLHRRQDVRVCVRVTDREAEIERHKEKLPHIMQNRRMGNSDGRFGDGSARKAGRIHDDRNLTLTTKKQSVDACKIAAASSQTQISVTLCGCG